VRRNRFTLRIHQVRHWRIVRVDLYIDGRKVKSVRGHRVRRLTLSRPAGRNDFRVVIVAWSANGRRTISVRHFHSCR
jgi:hypothetical protein